MNSRIEALEKLLARNPQDSRIRFGLAAEYEKAGQWERVAAQLQAYLETADDQGNAWGRLARALRRLGRADEARAAYLRGIDAALRHGHPSMATEFEQELEEP